MRTVLGSLIFLAMLLVSVTPAAAQNAAAAPRQELRGVYMELSPNEKYGTFPLVPNGMWRGLFAKLKALGVNAVFPNVVSARGACYPSKVVPTLPPAQCLFSPDLLDEITDAAHAEGIEVHAWTIEWYLAPDSTDPERLVHGPDGKTVNSLCPSQEVNRELMRRMLTELADKYQLDGILYDYIRLPEGDYCYCGHCRAAFEKSLGHKVESWPKDVQAGGPLAAQYMDYLCGTVSSFVQEMRPLLKKARPGLVISAAVWCNDHSDRNESVRQDWGLWAREGWLDFITPMNYGGSPYNVQHYEQFARNEAARVAGRIPLVFSQGAFQDTPAGEVAQVRLGRELGGSGAILYTLTKSIMSDILPVLQREVWSEPAEAPAFGRTGLEIKKR
ncbi:family 10 glycosylhydrolase [bacterium]|nr:family 10 glycosylhydrolase [bacterium]